MAFNLSEMWYEYKNGVSYFLKEITNDNKYVLIHFEAIDIVLVEHVLRSKISGSYDV